MKVIIGDIGNTVTNLCLIDINTFKLSKIVYFDSKNIFSKNLLRKKIYKLEKKNNLSKIVFRSLYRVRFTSRHRLKHCLPFAHKFVESTVLPWKAVPVQDDATLRPGQNLEYIRSIVSGRL